MNLLSSCAVIIPGLIVCLCVINLYHSSIGLLETVFINIIALLYQFVHGSKKRHKPNSDIPHLILSFVSGTSGTVSCFAAYFVCNTIFSSIRLIIGNKNVGWNTKVYLVFPHFLKFSDWSPHLCSIMTSGSHAWGAYAMIFLTWRSFSIWNLSDRA